MVPEVGVPRRVPIVPELVVVGTAAAAGPKLIWPPAVISVVDLASSSPLSSWQKTFPRRKDNNSSRMRLDNPKMVEEEGIVQCGKQRGID